MYVVFNEMIIFITGCPYHHGLQGRHRQQGSDSMIFKTEDVDDMLDIDDAIMFQYAVLDRFCYIFCYV